MTNNDAPSPNHTGIQEDQRLVQRILAGDSEAFEHIVRQCDRPLRLYLASRCASISMADEVLQSTYITVYENLHSWRGDARLLSWVTVIARNRLYAHLREQSRITQVDPNDIEALLSQRLLKNDSKNDEIHDYESVIQHMRSCLKHMPQRSQALLQARYAEGNTLGQLARRWKKTKHILSQQLLRIRQRLRTCIETKGASLP